MAASAEVINNIVVGLSRDLFVKQSTQFKDQYVVNGALTPVEGIPSLVYNDILPHHPLFVSNVKLEYIVTDLDTLDLHADREIKVSVEFQTEKIGQL